MDGPVPKINRTDIICVVSAAVGLERSKVLILIDNKPGSPCYSAYPVDVILSSSDKILDLGLTNTPSCAGCGGDMDYNLGS